MADGSLVFLQDPGAYANAKRLPMQLWRANSNGSGLAPVPVVSQPGCATHYRQPAALDSRRFAVLKICDTDSSSTVAIVSKDSITGQETGLVPPETDFSTTEFSWSATRKLGMVDNGGPTPCPQLEWADETGLHPVDITVKETHSTWHLNGGTGACPGSTRAGTAGWSPDGNTLAAFASAIPANNAPLLPGDPWSLYFVDANSKTAAAKLDGIVYPGGSAWSKDGRLFAFSAASYRGAGPGVWIFDRRTATVSLIFKGDLGSLSWSPDGKRLAAVKRPKGDAVRYSMVLLDLWGA